jgi:hypothetical protein
MFVSGSLLNHLESSVHSNARETPHRPPPFSKKIKKNKKIKKKRERNKRREKAKEARKL